MKRELKMMNVDAHDDEKLLNLLNDKSWVAGIGDRLN